MTRVYNLQSTLSSRVVSLLMASELRHEEIKEISFNIANLPARIHGAAGFLFSINSLFNISPLSK